MSRTELPRRAELEKALSELGRPWRGGPFAEPARALLAAAQPRIRDRLTTFDQVAVVARAAAPVSAGRYAELTGRAVEADLLAFYRLRWALDDLSAFAGRLRAEHRRTADTEHAWRSLEQTVAQLAAD